MQNISILLPVKNGGNYLRDSIPNLQEISGASDEIVIIDDFSTDETRKIIEMYQAEDPRIKFLQNRNPGLVNALNLGISQSSNEWIARCDADDLYDVNRIEMQKLEIRENVSCIFSDYSFFSENNPRLGMLPSAIFSSAVSVSLARSRRTAHPSVMYSKSAVLSVGGYRNEDFPAEDLSLWLRLGKEGKLVSVPKILLKYRLVESSVSVKKRKLIQDKTRILLGKIGINTKDYLFVKNNIEDILERYDQFEFAERRKLLLLTELFSISFNPKKYGISAQSRTNNLIDLKLFLNFQFPAEIIRLRKEKYSRDMIRKLASIEK